MELFEYVAIPLTKNFSRRAVENLYFLTENYCIFDAYCAWFACAIRFLRREDDFLATVVLVFMATPQESGEDRRRKLAPPCP